MGLTASRRSVSTVHEPFLSVSSFNLVTCPGTLSVDLTLPQASERPRDSATPGSLASVALSVVALVTHMPAGRVWEAASGGSRCDLAGRTEEGAGATLLEDATE